MTTFDANEHAHKTATTSSTPSSCGVGTGTIGCRCLLLPSTSSYKANPRDGCDGGEQNEEGGVPAGWSPQVVEGPQHDEGHADKLHTGEGQKRGSRGVASLDTILA